MNWKKLLHFDLGRFIPGYISTEGPRPLFFIRWWRWLSGKVPRPTALNPIQIDDKNYQPGPYYRLCGKRWRGARYLTPKARNRDLLMVVSELTSIVRTNAPLMQGLEASAREEQRLYRQMSPRKLYDILHAALIGGGLFIFGGKIIIEEGENFGIATNLAIILPFIVVGIAYTTWVLSRRACAEAILLKLRDSIAAGESLSDGMQRLSKFFPRFYVDMVRAGEDTGKLAECLEELGEETLNTVSLGNTMRMNLMYLVMVMAVQGTILSFVLMKIIPVFAEVWGDFDSGLPAPTRSLLQVTDFIFYHWPNIFMAIATLGITLTLLNRFVERSRTAKIGMRGVRRRGFATRGYATLFLFVPGLRGFLIKQNLSTITLILEKLLKAGLPIGDALDSVTRADLNPLYRHAFLGVRQSVLQGTSLRDALDKQSGLVPIPKSFRGFVGLGEQSGMLPEALARIADLYRRDVMRGTRILSDTMLPLCVLMLGGITLYVLTACYLPIFTLSDQLNTTL